MQMMDIVPTMVDGAVILSLSGDCPQKLSECECCFTLTIHLHNWVKQTQMSYLIVDFEERKNICSGFFKEIIQLRKRLKMPFLFVGIVERYRSLLDAYNCSTIYPTFLTPEDAVRALRIQNPGLTEIPIKVPIAFDTPIASSLKSLQSESKEESQAPDIESFL